MFYIFLWRQLGVTCDWSKSYPWPMIAESPQRTEQKIYCGNRKCKLLFSIKMDEENLRSASVAIAFQEMSTD